MGPCLALLVSGVKPDDGGQEVKGSIRPAAEPIARSSLQNLRRDLHRNLCRGKANSTKAATKAATKVFCFGRLCDGFSCSPPGDSLDGTGSEKSSPPSGRLVSVVVRGITQQHTPSPAGDISHGFPAPRQLVGGPCQFVFPGGKTNSSEPPSGVGRLNPRAHSGDLWSDAVVRGRDGNPVRPDSPGAHEPRCRFRGSIRQQAAPKQQAPNPSGPS